MHVFNQHPHSGSHSGNTDAMRLGFAARYLPTYVRVYPCSESLEEFGKKASLDRFGNVLFSGENKYEYHRFVDSTVNGFRFPVRAAKAVEHD